MTEQSLENSIREPAGQPTTLVPTFLPPLAATPVPKQDIPFWRALFLYPLKRKWGPHLACGSTAKAFAAYLLALASGIVLGGLAYLIASGAFSPGGPGLRVQLALTIRDCILMPFQRGPRKDIGSLILISPLVLTGVLLAHSLLAAPAVEAGDGLLSACKRSINDSFWTMTVLPWWGGIAVVLFVAQQIVDANIVHTGVLSWLELFIHDYTICAIVGVVGVFLAINTWRSGASEYVGPAAGPGFLRRRVHCEDCGYLIGGLPMASRCPECGLTVRASLPGGRRAELAPDAEKLSLFRPGQYARFWWMMFRGERSAIQRVPMHGERAARRFLWIGYAYGAVATEAVLVAMWSLAQMWNDRTAIAVNAVAMVAIAAFPILQLIVVVGAVISGRLRYGIGDIRLCKTVANYSAVMLGPIAILIVVQCLIVFIHPLRGLMIHVYGMSIDAIGIPSVLLGGLALYFSIKQSRLCRVGLRAAAFANS